MDIIWPEYFLNAKDISMVWRKLIGYGNPQNQFQVKNYDILTNLTQAITIQPHELEIEIHFFLLWKVILHSYMPQQSHEDSHNTNTAAGVDVRIFCMYYIIIFILCNAIL